MEQVLPSDFVRFTRDPSLFFTGHDPTDLSLGTAMRQCVTEVYEKAYLYSSSQALIHRKRKRRRRKRIHKSDSIDLLPELYTEGMVST